MLSGTVVGNVWATRKEEGLTGLKLLVVQPDNSSLQTIIAVDRIGAGIDDHVMVTVGTPASLIEEKHIPIDALIIGIVDSIAMDKDGNNG